MKKPTDRLLKILASLAAGVLLTLTVSSGILSPADGVISDRFYQSPSAGLADTAIIGIDDRAFEKLGPWPWSRHVMADLIRRLNDVPEDQRPAAIGIDVLFTGPSQDPSADQDLAEACAEGGNVIAASSALFGSGLITDRDTFYMADRQVLGWEGPYPALAEACGIAHINTMEDEDAILRHGILSIHVPERGDIPSLSRALYERWCASEGVVPNPSPETESGFFYIPFTKEPGGYSDGISVIDVLDGSVPAETFAGKILLIGPYAPALQDEYRTSVSHAEPMYGVEIHANMIDAFTRGFYPKEAPRALQLALLFALSAGLMFFCLDRAIPAAAGAWLLTGGAFCGIAKLLYAGPGLVLHVLWVPLALTLVFIASVAANYIRARREKNRISRTFGRYVDPAVMKQLLSQGPEALSLGGKMYNIAVLFVDIRGFTSMSESLDPPTVVEIINKYLTLTTDCIMKNHGTLDKFVGDCTMAFWNAPVEQEDPVFLACAAAMDMVEGSKALGLELEKRFGRTVHFGIGVHYGPAVVGNIGAPKRMDYTAIGDTVNTASRLESNAPGGKILISRTVADMLGEKAEVTSLGSSIKLKGKAEGFEVLTLDHLNR